MVDKTGQSSIEMDSDSGVSSKVSEDFSDDIKVLIVGPAHGGGIVSYIENQVRELDDRVVTSTYDSGARPRGADRIWFLRGLLMSVFAILRFPFRTPPNILHVHTSHGYSFYRKSLYVWFAGYVWNIPVVLHIHGSAFDEFVKTDSRIVAAWQRRVFKASDEIIVLSEYWKDVVSTRADTSKIRVLPNAVDPGTFPADPTDDIPHIVFVSNLIERKGVEELAAAIEQLTRRQAGAFHVSIAGDGPLRERVKKLADQHSEVNYLGYVSEDEKRTLLGDASIYVLPTYAEGLPFALLEGMAGANAVVSTSVGSIPEVIGPENGILVEPGSVDELVAALEELITAPERRAQMAKNNRRMIEERYSWNRVIDRVMDVYKSIIK